MRVCIRTNSWSIISIGATGLLEKAKNCSNTHRVCGVPFGPYDSIYLIRMLFQTVRSIREQLPVGFKKFLYLFQGSGV